MKILIVDDDTLVREGLRMILESEEGFTIVGTASNGEEALKLCHLTQPEVILMDIRMPVMDGVEATKLIKESYKDIKILLLTTFKDEEYIRSAVIHGAEGYVLKSNSSENIIESIKTVYQGNVVFEKEIASRLSNMMTKNKALSTEELNITQKEHSIMELLSKGCSNREISEKFYMSEGTVRNSISALLDKLDLRDRTQLAIFFIRNLEK